MEGDIHWENDNLDVSNFLVAHESTSTPRKSGTNKPPLEQAGEQREGEGHSGDGSLKDSSDVSQDSGIQPLPPRTLQQLPRVSPSFPSSVSLAASSSSSLDVPGSRTPASEIATPPNFNNVASTNTNRHPIQESGNEANCCSYSQRLGNSTPWPRIGPPSSNVVARRWKDRSRGPVQESGDEPRDSVVVQGRGAQRQAVVVSSPNHVADDNFNRRPLREPEVELRFSTQVQEDYSDHAMIMIEAVVVTLDPTQHLQTCRMCALLALQEFGIVSRDVYRDDNIDIDAIILRDVTSRQTSTGNLLHRPSCEMWAENALAACRIRRRTFNPHA